MGAAYQVPHDAGAYLGASRQCGAPEPLPHKGIAV